MGIDGPVNMTDTINTSATEVKAAAFDIIAKYIHDVYGEMAISNITSDEAFFVTVVKTTEDLLDAFRPKEGL
jgi:hypothetical protein